MGRKRERAPEVSNESLKVLAYEAQYYMQKTRFYRFFKNIYTGAYSVVFAMVPTVPSREKKIRRAYVMKCSTDPGKMELELWSSFEHKNIAKLLGLFIFRSYVVFVMPWYRCDLRDVCKEPMFYAWPMSLSLIRIWLLDIMKGLAYIHGMELAHLNIRLENSFLRNDGHVCLGDFSLMMPSKEVKNINANTFQESLTPPEFTPFFAELNKGKELTENQISGYAVDIWQFGILIIDILTNRTVSLDKNSAYEVWKWDVHPYLEKIVEIPMYMECLLESNFELNRNKGGPFSNTFRNLIQKVLKIDPTKRPSAYEACEDDLLTRVPWPHVNTPVDGVPKELELPACYKGIERPTFWIPGEPLNPAYGETSPPAPPRVKPPSLKKKTATSGSPKSLPQPGQLTFLPQLLPTKQGAPGAPSGPGITQPLVRSKLMSPLLQPVSKRDSARAKSPSPTKVSPVKVKSPSPTKTFAELGARPKIRPHMFGFTRSKIPSPKKSSPVRVKSPSPKKVSPVKAKSPSPKKVSPVKVKPASPPKKPIGFLGTRSKIPPARLGGTLRMRAPVLVKKGLGTTMIDKTPPPPRVPPRGAVRIKPALQAGQKTAQSPLFKVPRVPAIVKGGTVTGKKTSPTKKSARTGKTTSPTKTSARTGKTTSPTKTSARTGKTTSPTKPSLKGTLRQKAPVQADKKKVPVKPVVTKKVQQGSPKVVPPKGTAQKGTSQQPKGTSQQPKGTSQQPKGAGGSATGRTGAYPPKKWIGKSSGYGQRKKGAGSPKKK